MVIQKTNTANKTDGNGLLKEITDFSNKVADPDLETPKFDTFKDNTLTAITNLINDGDGDISAENVMNSFMFDKTFILNGEETGFLEWYLDNEDLMPATSNQVVDVHYELDSNNDIMPRT